jgi:hypothetical protein
MSDTPRTDVAQHNIGSIMEPHYVVDVEVAHDLERELAEAKEQLHLCNVDQFTTAAELAEARKDAERYRYVRSIWGLPDENFNAAIDEAMKEGGK